MNKGKMSWGVILIGIGVYLFAYKLGYINSDQLSNFARSWPLLFVVWGFDLLIPEKLWWLQLILVVLLVAIATFVSVHVQFPGGKMII